MKDEGRKTKKEVLKKKIDAMSDEELDQIAGGLIKEEYVDVIGDDCIVVVGMMSNGMYTRTCFPYRVYGSKECALESAIDFAKKVGISTEGIDNI